MELKKIVVSIAIIFAFTMVFNRGIVFAQTEPNEENNVNQEESSFQNHAQTQHAENLASAYAEKAEQRMAEAEIELNKIDRDKDPDGYAIALADYENALLAKEGGVSIEDIEKMRADGMGWGQIAHALGIHPGVSGNGHKNKEQEWKMATARNMNNGLSIGHGNDGFGIGRSEYKKGIGQGSDKDKGDNNGVGKGKNK